MVSTMSVISKAGRPTFRCPRGGGPRVETPPSDFRRSGRRSKKAVVLSHAPAAPVFNRILRTVPAAIYTQGNTGQEIRSGP